MQELFGIEMEENRIEPEETYAVRSTSSRYPDAGKTVHPGDAGGRALQHGRAHAADFVCEAGEGEYDPRAERQADLAPRRRAGVRVHAGAAGTVAARDDAERVFTRVERHVVLDTLYAPCRRVAGLSGVFLRHARSFLNYNTISPLCTTTEKL